MIDERTERLINRKLDGELSEAEALELNKRLIRSPEARALSEEYAQLDALANKTLGTVLPDPSDEAASPESIEQVLASPRRQRWHTAVGAVAAMFLAAVLSGLPGNWLAPQAGPVNGSKALQAYQAGMAMPSALGEVISGPRNEDQRVHREVIGIYDEETNSIYFIERDATHTTTVPVVANY